MTERVALGPIGDIPIDHCVAAADDRVVVVRVGDEVHAYRNRCLHQDAPLAGGWVRGGVLSCPLHFWRYEVMTGQIVGGTSCLDRFPVEVEGDDVFVILPDEAPRRSLRDELLARAATYDREAAFRADTAAGPDPR